MDLTVVLSKKVLSGFFLQGDNSACAKPPVDFKTKVPLWSDLLWPGQAKAELLS